MNELINLKEVSKTFGSFNAVDGISFSVLKGEIVGFLGPNGAGKTTTMRLISGYLPLTSGQIKVDNFNVTDDPLKVQSIIGYLPEGGPLYQDMDVCSYLNFILNIRNLQGSYRKERLDFVVENLNLQNVFYKRIYNLSKGYKRRVAFSQALIHDPKVLILDEPTDGLDPNQKHEVRQLINNIAKDKAIIISTHLLEEVEIMCNKIYLINEGKIVFKGDTESLFAKDPNHNSFRVKVENNINDSLIDKIKSDNYVNNVSKLSDSEILISLNEEEPGDKIKSYLSNLHIEINSLHQVKGDLNISFKKLTNK